MGKHITTENSFFRTQREFKMVRQIILMITTLIVPGLPYTVFMFLSYHPRIGLIDTSSSLLFVALDLFYFRDPLKLESEHFLYACIGAFAKTSKIYSE